MHASNDLILQHMHFNKVAANALQIKFPFKRKASQVLKLKCHHTFSLLKCRLGPNAVY